MQVRRVTKEEYWRINDAKNAANLRTEKINRLKYLK